MKQQFIVGVAGTIRATVYDSNRPIVPSSAQITLYKTDGTNELQALATASVNSTTGEMTYALTSSHTATKGLNYKAVWTYVYNGVTYYETQLFDVVRSVLSVPINDEDLYEELPSLLKENIQAKGTASSGSTTNLVDTVERKEVDNYWKGGVIEIISGTGSGQKRDVASFTQSSGTLVPSPDFTTAPDSTSKYRVIKSWTSSIMQGFEKLEQMLYDAGRRDALILESSQIKVVLTYLVIKSICLDLRQETDDKWDMLYRDYSTLFEKAFTSLKLDYDEDESGGISGEEAQTKANSITIFRG